MRQEQRPAVEHVGAASQHATTMSTPEVRGPDPFGCVQSGAPSHPRRTGRDGGSTDHPGRPAPPVEWCRGRAAHLGGDTSRGCPARRRPRAVRCHIVVPSPGVDQRAAAAQDDVEMFGYPVPKFLPPGERGGRACTQSGRLAVEQTEHRRARVGTRYVVAASDQVECGKTAAAGCVEYRHGCDR